MKLNEYELKRLKKERMEEIDKWLDNEYGCSYTKLEELHNYWLEKSTNQKLEIERLNNIINELEKWAEGYIFADIFKDKIKELEENKK